MSRRCHHVSFILAILALLVGNPAFAGFRLHTPTATATSGGPTMTPTPPIPTRPQLLCRGGQRQGEICWADADCPAFWGTPGPASTPGICPRFGGPRRCRWERRCLVSTTVKCGSNQDCPLYPNSANMRALGGVGVNIGDACNSDNHQMLGWECQTDADCKMCTAGTNIGYQCANNGDCGTGGVCGAGGSGKCLNGMSMDECSYTNTVGDAHDNWGDQAVISRSGQDTEIGAMDKKRIRHATAIGFNKSNGDMFIKDVVRVTKRSPAFSTNMDASEAIGQRQFVHQQDEGIPGDITHCAIGSHAPEIAAWTLYGDVTIYSGANSGSGFDFGSVQGIWTASRYAITRHAIDAVTGEAPEFILGFKDPTQLTGQSWYAISDNPGQVSLQPRCQGGSNQGAQCAVDTDCPSSTCKVDLIFCDSGDASHCGIWKDIGHARSGAAPDIALGFNHIGYCEWGANVGNACQMRCASGADAGKVCVDSTDCAGGAACSSNFDCAGANCKVSVYCNTYNSGAGEATSAHTLCFPYGANFDNAGRPVIADGARWHTNRVLRYPKDVATGGDADLVAGHGNFTDSAGACDSTHLLGPHMIDFDSTGRMCVADTGCNRVVCMNNWTTSGQAWDIPLLQPDLVSSGAAYSSNNSSCDRGSGPMSIKFDGSDNLGIADYGHGRVFRIDAPLTAGKAGNIDTLQGVPDCTTGHPLTNARVADPYGAGVVDTNPGLLVMDPGSNRGLWWDTIDHARMIDSGGEVTAANAAIGQADATKFYPNKGSSAGVVPTPSSSSLSGPRISAYTDQGLKPGAWIPDTNNHRGVRAVKPFATGMTFSDVVGQATFNGASANRGGSVGNNTLNFPVCAHADKYGNIWWCDYNNQRVVLQCEAANTVPKIGGGFKCTAGNSGDGTFDMVLGKATFTEGFSSTPCNSANPSETKLCAPADLIVDLDRNRVVVADQRIGGFGGDDQSGRTLVFQGPFDDGMGALSCIGCPAAVPSLPAKTRGFCTNAAGASAGQECSYQEPWGANAGSGGKTCVAPAGTFGAGCSINANCDSSPGAGDGLCGCPGSHPYCFWDRSIGMPGTLAMHPTRDAIVVTRVAWPLHRGALEFRDTGIYNWQPASRVYGQEGETAFERTSTGSVGSDGLWVVFSGSGISFDGGGDLYVPADDGSQYQTVIHVLDDPLPENTATPTPSVTPTITDTPIPGLTSTPTPSATPSFTLTRTFTPTWTFTVTSTPSTTPTVGAPTSTPGPGTPSSTVPPTATPVPGQPNGAAVVNPFGSVAVVAPSESVGSTLSFREAKINGFNFSNLQAPNHLMGSTTHYLTALGNLPLDFLEAPGFSDRCVRISEDGTLEPASTDCITELKVASGTTCTAAYPLPPDGARCVQHDLATDTVSTMPSLWFGANGEWVKVGAYKRPEFAWAGTCAGTTPTARDLSVPSSGAPTLACISGTNLPTKAVLSFPSGSTTCAYAEFSGDWIVPEFAGVITLITQASTNSGTAAWEIATVCHAQGTTDDSVWQNVTALGPFNVLSTLNSTAEYIFGYGPPCPPTNFTRVRVCRTGGTVANMHLLAVRKDVVIP